MINVSFLGLIDLTQVRGPIEEKKNDVIQQKNFFKVFIGSSVGL